MKRRASDLSKYKMSLKELLKSDEFRWFNVFFRDLLLVLVVMSVQYWSHFKSKWVFFITGMLVVWISWQFSDFLDYKRRII